MTQEQTAIKQYRETICRIALLLLETIHYSAFVDAERLLGRVEKAVANEIKEILANQTDLDETEAKELRRLLEGLTEPRRRPRRESGDVSDQH